MRYISKLYISIYINVCNFWTWEIVENVIESMTQSHHESKLEFCTLLQAENLFSFPLGLSLES